MITLTYILNIYYTLILLTFIKEAIFVNTLTKTSSHTLLWDQLLNYIRMILRDEESLE
jgi:hypothetical protein